MIDLDCNKFINFIYRTLALSLSVNGINWEPEDRNKLFESVVKGSALGTSLALDALNSSLPEMRNLFSSITFIFSVFGGYIGTNALRNKVPVRYKYPNIYTYNL